LYAIIAKSASTSSPAIVHAVVSERAPGTRGAEPGPPDPPPGAAVPHRWQKRACAESSAWHVRQVRAPTGAPQVLQKLPVPGVPQAGQGRGVVVAVIAGKSNPDAGFAGRRGGA
jgi:hypothetical protein